MNPNRTFPDTILMNKTVEGDDISAHRNQMSLEFPCKYPQWNLKDPSQSRFYSSCDEI